MGVERVDHYSEDEYQQALEFEREYWLEQEPEQEPDIVSCFKCGCQMYWVSYTPEENICDKCKKDINK